MAVFSKLGNAKYYTLPPIFFHFVIVLCFLTTMTILHHKNFMWPFINFMRKNAPKIQKLKFKVR